MESVRKSLSTVKYSLLMTWRLWEEEDFRQIRHTPSVSWWSADTFPGVSDSDKTVLQAPVLFLRQWNWQWGTGGRGHCSHPWKPRPCRFHWYWRLEFLCTSSDDILLQWFCQRMVHNTGPFVRHATPCLCRITPSFLCHILLKPKQNQN